MQSVDEKMDLVNSSKQAIGTLNKRKILFSDGLLSLPVDMSLNDFGWFKRGILKDTKDLVSEHKIKIIRLTQT